MEVKGLSVLREDLTVASEGRRVRVGWKDGLELIRCTCTSSTVPAGSRRYKSLARKGHQASNSETED